MPYLPPFSIIKKSFNINSDNNGLPRTQLQYDQLIDLIKSLIRATPVDTDWYYKEYPDVAAAVAEGKFKSARHHFIENGYFEGRKPFDAEVDEEWYISTYEDVAEGIEMGEIPSAKDHFIHHGWSEGRLPMEY